ncbi:sigma-70 family RNA polymerase sigma factor [Pseudoflavitalea sp. X16]|uniref:RNA polymerase sigma factor n=1 Tax=Paraflavitalea devenefica TaxID=2716334 RepID=UPI00142311FF|nr:sigma-70 family RNA polymerase sigma factor [Paraflavitalea devenefica]NII26494.1 sigma-70 family RNA polymerase sigma factor [Paraflavitalea devenefica]
MQPAPSSSNLVFTRLYLETRDRVFAYLSRFTSDTTLIEDLLQQCYLKIWERIEVIRDPAEALPLVKTYARNLLIDEVRRRMREDAQWLENLEKETGSITESYISDNGRAQLQALDQAIDRLPGNCREVFLMHREKGMSYREIAEQLSLSVSMVEKYMSRAIRLLKNDLLTDYNLILTIVASSSMLKL